MINKNLDTTIPSFFFYICLLKALLCGNLKTKISNIKVKKLILKRLTQS